MDNIKDINLLNKDILQAKEDLVQVKEDIEALKKASLMGEANSNGGDKKGNVDFGS